MKGQLITRGVLGLVTISSLALAPSLATQQALDRTKIPPAGPPPVLRMPTWTTSMLANGAELIVSERHDLPLVSFTLNFLGGGYQFATADRPDLGALTAAMMTEGTTTRDGKALSNALQLLGTNLEVGVDGESGSISFVSTTANFEPTLAILADVLEHPTFPEGSLERLRAQRLVALAEAEAQPAVALRVFPRILYGNAHPFGSLETEDTINATTRADIVAFYKAYFQPGRALVTVVGDVKAASVKTEVDRAFSAWPKGGSKPTFEYPPVRPQRPTTIFLLDRPGAVQSVVVIGVPGPPVSAPDYFPFRLMNWILGGLGNPASRLNLNLRVGHGYTYTVASSFPDGRGPEPFHVGAAIVSDKSSVALVEIMKELRGIQGSRPVTDDELATAKEFLIQSMQNRFATVQGVNTVLSQLWTLGRPSTYFQNQASHVSAVTKDDVVRAAQHYLDLDHLAIVIVGDRASIQGPLEATHIAPVEVVDLDGNVVPVPAGGSIARR